MKKQLLVILFSIFCTIGFAQFYAIKSVFVGLHTPPSFSINVGTEYAPKVSKTTYLFVRPTYNRRGYGGDRTGNYSYIDIPVGLKFFITGDPVKDFGQTIDFNIGPYIGYALKGKYRPTVGAPEKNITFGTGANAQFDNIDYGYFANTQLGIGPLLFGLSAQIGLKQQDLSRLGLSASNAKFKANKLYTLTIGIRLANKKMTKAINNRN